MPTDSFRTRAKSGLASKAQSALGSASKSGLASKAQSAIGSKAKSAIGSKAQTAIGRKNTKQQPSLGKTVAKKAIKSSVKNSARAASMGTSVAVEVGIALFTTKTGRRILLALLLVAILGIMFLIAAPFMIVSNEDNMLTQISGAVTGQAVNSALQNTPGVPPNLPAAVLSPFKDEEQASGVPWEILFAVAYYERLGGVAVADQSGICPPTASTMPYCPSVSSTIVPQVKYAVGPLGYNGKLLSSYGINRSSVSTLSGALSVIGSTIQSYMDSQNVPGSAGLLSGIQDTGTGTVAWSPTQNAVAYDSAMLGALKRLPIIGQSATLDKNIFFLAQEFEIGTVTPAVSGGYGNDMVCAVGNSKTVTIAGKYGNPMTLDQQQIANAAIIVHTAQSMGVPQQGMVIGIMTALQESSLFNYPNAKIPSSFSDPNMQMGGYTQANPPNNGTSLGLFQQQNNWGTVAERMNQSYAAAHFFRHMEGVPNWQALPLGLVAQTVQRSAYPLAYAPWQPGASTLVGAVLGIQCSTSVNTANMTGTAKTVITAAQQFVGNTPYVWGGGTSLGPSMGLNGRGAVGPAGYQGKPGFDCSGLTLYAYSKAGITLPHYSGLGGQFSIVEHSPTFTTNISQLQPGDLVFFVGQGDGGTRANPGHVGIYIGNGKMIDVPTTGQFVSIDPVNQSSAGGFVGGGMP